MQRAAPLASPQARAGRAGTLDSVLRPVFASVGSDVGLELVWELSDVCPWCLRKGGGGKCCGE